MPRLLPAFALARAFVPMGLGGLLALVGACGGKAPATAAQAKAPPAEADPYTLLPPAAVVVVKVHAKAVFGNGAIGGDVATLADQFVPLGNDAGFHPKTDVDEVLAAGYATSGGDVAAVLVGRFDVDRIAHATKTKRAGTIVSEPHPGGTLYRSGREAWSPLTAKTLIAGTPEGVRDVLDCVAKGTLDRWEPAWMLTTLETPSVTFAVAGDFASRPLAAAAIGVVSLPWVKGIHQVRATGVLRADALDVDATVTYGNPGEAKDAEGGMRRSVQMLDVLGAVLGGLRLQGFDTKVDAQDLRVTFGLDAQTLHTLATLAPSLMPSP